MVILTEISSMFSNVNRVYALKMTFFGKFQRNVNECEIFASLCIKIDEIYKDFL